MVDLILGAKRVTKVGVDNYMVRVGAVAFQLDTSGIKDLISLLTQSIGVVAVEEHDLKAMTIKIEELLKGENVIPLKQTTNDNNYIPSTEDIIKQKQELNKNS